MMPKVRGTGPYREGPEVGVHGQDNPTERDGALQNLSIAGASQPQRGDGEQVEAAGAQAFGNGGRDVLVGEKG